jgi:hypothetical protein
MLVIPLKNGPCAAGCGIIIQYRTNPKVLCADCRASRKAEQSRLSMERQRRKRGVPEVKGTERPCEGCGRPIVLQRNAATKWCGDCAILASRDRARKSSAAKFATPEGKEYAARHWAERYHSRPDVRVSAHMKVLIHRALGRGKAGRSWKTFVPYTLEELMAHLERQFLKGMTWENKGEWHVDHIRPLASFSIEGPDCPDFAAAWALSNLRPMWALDNIRKNARRTHLLRGP